MDRNKLIDHLIQTTILGVISYGVMKFDKLSDEVTTISRAILQMSIENKAQDKILDQHDAQLKDHDKRIGVVEFYILPRNRR